MFYEDVFKKLNKARVDYLVAGGVALVLHGVVRLTADLDLLVHLDRKNLEKFIEVMAELGYKPKLPVDVRELMDHEIREKWINEKNMKVFSFYNPNEPISLIDIFVNEPIDYGMLKENSIKVKSENLTIPVVSIHDLIKMKKISGRPQDIADINALKEKLKR